MAIRQEKFEQQCLYIINLDDKPKRLERMQNDLKGALPDGFELVRWEATRHAEGWKGCIQSHAKVLKYLLDKYGKNAYHLMMILEDDCKLLELKPVFKYKFPKYVDYLRAHQGEWDMFITGGIYPIPTRIVCRDPFIIECDWLVCAQFNIHSQKSAKMVIDYCAKPSGWQWSLDTYLSRQLRGKIWVPYPMLTIQHCEDSSIGANSYLDTIRDEFQKAIQVFDDFVQTQNQHHSK